MKHITSGLGLPRRETGSCAEHGESQVTLFGEGEWYCSQCMEIRIKADLRLLDAKNRHDGMMATADLPKRYHGQRFMAHNEEHKNARATAKEFLDAACTDSWHALVLSGVTGTGKTLMASELAEAYMAKTHKTAKYAAASAVLGEIRATYDSGNSKSEAGEIRRYADYGLLILDEIDMVRGTDNDILLLTEIVNRRYNAGRPLIVITNKSRESLAEFMGERIDDRLYEDGFSIVFAWASFRRK